MEGLGSPKRGRPFCMTRIHLTYTKRCKPLATVCSGLQQFAARPPRGACAPPGTPKKHLRRMPEALLGGSGGR
eukprot:8425557-Alexandrium_andersonii.AAC.1